MNPSESESKWLHEERQHFEENLDSYVRQFYAGPWLAYRKRIWRLLERQMDSRLRILDVGCGPLPSLPQAPTAGGQYVALDIAEANVNYLKGRTPRAQTVRADANHLPFERAAFDVVIFFGVLHHAYDYTRTLAEGHRVLKPGGVVVSHEPSDFWTGKMGSPNERGFSKRQLQELFSQFDDFELHEHDYIQARRLRNACRRLGLLHVIREDLIWDFTISVIEPLLDTCGFAGTDYVVTARKRQREKMALRAA